MILKREVESRQKTFDFLILRPVIYHECTFQYPNSPGILVFGLFGYWKAGKISMVLKTFSKIGGK